MSDFNSQHNRAVWFDIPVSDLDRAIGFYSGVLNIKVSKEQFGDISLGLLQRKEGNGGCLVLNEADITSDKGILVYMNVDKRLKDAVEKVKINGGTVVQDIHSIGPHGSRAIVLDSEGNRLALHST